MTFQNQLEALGAPVILLEDLGGIFDGEDDFVEIAHEPLLELNEGTWSFTFSADNPGAGTEMLLSKDHSGYKDGGHLTMWITHDQRLEVRFQGTDSSINLRTDREAITADQDYHVVFTFTEDTIALYLDGELIAARDGVDGGMSGNTEDLVLAASTVSRWEDNDNLCDFFDGTIGDLAVFDRALEPVEVLLLSESAGAAAAIGETPPEADIVGDAGNNRLYGTDADDIMDGGAGNDILNGRAGGDIMMGGAGDDRFYVDGPDDEIIEGFGEGYDRVYAAGDYTLGDNLEAISANGTGGRALTGNELANWVTGGAGNDALMGAGGNDRVQGRDGNDLIQGGTGNDILAGGAGIDIFRFGRGDGSDVIQDFEIGTDLIAISGGLSMSRLHIYDSANGAVVRYDAMNGDDVSLVVLNGVNASQLDANDFSF